MLWDIINTLLEFLTIYLLFTSFAHIRILEHYVWIYLPISIGLSVFFCLDIPHILVLNIGLFIATQCLSFSVIPFRERLLYSVCSVFITMSLEMLFNTFLPMHLLHTFRGDTMSNIVMVLISFLYYLGINKSLIPFDITAFLKRRFVLLLICFVIWTALIQVYILQASRLWSYIPGVVSLVFFSFFIVGMILDIRYYRSEEHKQNVIYKENLQSIEKYLQEIKIENHNYKHHIHHLQSMVQTATNLDDLKLTIDSYVTELDESSELLEMILAISNIQYKALLYGAYMQCTQREISFSFTATQILPSFPIDDYQLVVAIENLISNAVEANEVLPDSADRFINISLYADANKNEISISNPLPSFSGDINDFLISGNSSKTSSDHSGLGLPSILLTMSSHKVYFFGKYDDKRQTICYTIQYVMEANRV
ncbi:MAG: GHKL domain-containing protein [Firmicutes bacterium]|nr:GHKL domain-containing protein [Bacillota bacterium]